MKDLKVSGRILGLILREWETSRVLALKREWRKQRQMQRKVEGEAETGTWEMGREGTV